MFYAIQRHTDIQGHKMTDPVDTSRKNPTIYAWKANRTEAIKPYKTVKYETNSAVFVTMVKMLHNNEGIADIASEQ